MLIHLDLLCPTRWTVRAVSLQSVFYNYEMLLQGQTRVLLIVK